MKTTSAKCAAQIRKDLNAAYPEITFRVTSKRYSGGSSVNVSWVNGPTRASVERLIGKYKYGSFNGMSDCYDYKNVIEGLDQVKYLFCEREYTAEIVAAAIEQERRVNDWETLGSYEQERRVYSKLQAMGDL